MRLGASDCAAAFFGGAALPLHLAVKVMFFPLCLGVQFKISGLQCS